MERPRVELRLDHGDREAAAASTSAHQQVAAEEVDAGSSSSETSHSGGEGGDRGAAHISSLAGGSSGTDWNVANNGIEVEEPLWEWEQLNWLSP